MLRFLSADWLAAFDAALRADRDLAARFAANPITIAQEITGEDGPVVRYVIVLDGDGGRLVAEASPDVTLVCDRETAAALARGMVNAQRALTAGRFKLRGEVDRLAAASGALAGLRDVLGELRANTEF
jgi:putative sterol carrier protein